MVFRMQDRQQEKGSRPSWLIRFLAFSARNLLGRYLKVCCHGLEHLPEEGSYILACNHRSILDPILVLAYAIHANQRMIVAAARKGLFRGPLRPVMQSARAIPIDRRSRHQLGAIRALLNCLRQDPVLIFPEGAVATGEPLSQARIGVGFLAQKSGVPVVPAFISGTDRVLPPGARTLRRHPVILTVGPPLVFSEDLAKNREAITQEIIRAMTQLDPERSRDIHAG